MSYPDLAEKIFLHPRPWILSGAGISTESGIADFRGPGGLWERIDPMAYFSVEALNRNPAGFYSLGMEMFDLMDSAYPNEAHMVLGELQQKRLLGPFVTQNIDSLHQKGGAQMVYEVHGHLRTATCIKCRRTIVGFQELSRMVRGGQVPPCCDCGGMLKPDVILFGDSMPDDYNNARSMLNLFKGLEPVVIVLGSSLSVSPINMLPLEFKEMYIINQGATMLDSRAALRIDGRAGESMGLLKEHFIDMNGGQQMECLPAGFLPGLLIRGMDMAAEGLAKAASRKPQIVEEKCLAEGLMVKKAMQAYPRRSCRQPLEEYWLNQVESRAGDLIARCGRGGRVVPLAAASESRLLTLLEDFVRTAVQAAEKYQRQARYEPRVLKELMLQALGAAGLLEYIAENGGLQAHMLKVRILEERIEGLAEASGIELDSAKALEDI